jgi:hypothetical protein
MTMMKLVRKLEEMDPTRLVLIGQLSRRSLVVRRPVIPVTLTFG